MGMATRKRSRIKETFVASPLKDEDRGDPGGKGKKANEKENQLSSVKSVIESEVTPVSGGDSLLRVFRVSHCQLEVVSEIVLWVLSIPSPGAARPPLPQGE